MSLTRISNFQHCMEDSIEYITTCIEHLQMPQTENTRKIILKSMIKEMESIEQRAYLYEKRS